MQARTTTGTRLPRTKTPLINNEDVAIRCRLDSSWYGSGT
jgi:hypothetical protein